MNSESAAGRQRFALLLAGVFLCVTVPRLLLHELWRDEAWLWLVVTEQRSLTDLLSPLSPLSRSGQGYLFPILCLLAARVSASPLALQILHGVLAAVAAFAVVRWAPCDWRLRALFVFGYFPFFEYAVISRHYVLGALLVWVICASARSGWFPLVGGAALGLLCQTTVYGFILAVALAGGWLLHRWIDRRGVAPLHRGLTAAGLALFLAGAGAGLVQMTPQPGTSFAAPWRLAWDPVLAQRVLATPWDALVPLPKPVLHFWNSNVLDNWPGVHAVAGLLALALIAALLWRRKVAVVTFGVGGAGLLAFGYLKLVGNMRHHGHWWILLAAAWWLAGGQRSEEVRPSWRGRIVVALLIVHCFAGAAASWMDLRHPFSNAYATARLIRDQRLDRHTLIAGREPTAAPVALALGSPLYFPGRGVFGSYPDWGPEQRELSDDQLRCAARERARREGRDVILVMNRELPPWAEIDDAGTRLGAILPSEDYRLYWLRFSRLALAVPPPNCEDSL